MTEFQAAKRVRTFGRWIDWRDNGCTAALDRPLGYDFNPACRRHDFAYLNYKAQGRYQHGKSRLDDNFKKDMYAECAKHKGAGGNICRSMAGIYYWAAKEFGDNYAMFQLPPDIIAQVENGTLVSQDDDQATSMEGESEDQ